LRNRPKDTASSVEAIRAEFLHAPGLIWGVPSLADKKLAGTVKTLIRMQLLTDYLRLLEDDRPRYVQAHSSRGNQAINGRADDPFGVVLDALEGTGLKRSALKLDLETAVANSSALSYLLGRPETIIIDDRDRVDEQLNGLD
jgi:hypothetical protein